MPQQIQVTFSAHQSAYDSGFQPGFGGTLEFRQYSLGVPPEVTQILFYSLN